MQPSDNTPAQTPLPEPPKQSFWAKLFGKKPAAPAVPQHESLAPQPRLDENTPDSEAPAVELQTAAPQTDSIIGTPHADDISAPDQNGEVTSLPIDVPSSIESPVQDGTAPTVQAVPQPAEPVQPPAIELQEPTAPQPVEPQVVTPLPSPEPTAPFQQPTTSVPPAQPQPPIQPVQPVTPQPPRPDQQ